MCFNAVFIGNIAVCIEDHNTAVDVVDSVAHCDAVYVEESVPAERDDEQQT